MTAVLYFARLTLLIVVAAAVYSKVSSLERFFAFEDVVGVLLGVGKRVRRFIGTAVVASELVTVCSLATDRAAKIGCVLALILMGAFFVVVARAVRAEITTECRCFGAEGVPLSASHVLRNAILVVIAGAGSLASFTVTTPSIIPSSHLASVVVLGAAAAALIVRWDDLAHMVAGASG